MKYVSNFVTIGLVAAVGAALLTAAAWAQDQAPLEEAHKSRIVANCASAKVSLQQLHRSDASLRVNRGQLYEFISTKLMARLNSRVALNRLDGSELVAAAARYERTLGAFRDAYKAYEEQLSSLLRIDCQQQPEEFYYQIEAARAKRQVVNQTTLELERHTSEYYQSFERFAASQSSNKQGQS